MLIGQCLVFREAVDLQDNLEQEVEEQVFQFLATWRNSEQLNHFIFLIEGPAGERGASGSPGSPGSKVQYGLKMTEVK